MSTTQNRTYKIVPVSEIIPGDFIKISRQRVDAVEVLGEVTRLTFASGRVGEVFSSERHGIYRKVG